MAEGPAQHLFRHSIPGIASVAGGIGRDGRPKVHGREVQSWVARGGCQGESHGAHPTPGSRLSPGRRGGDGQLSRGRLVGGGGFWFLPAGRITEWVWVPAFAEKTKGKPGKRERKREGEAGRRRRRGGVRCRPVKNESRRAIPPGLSVEVVPGTPEGLRSPDLHLERVASCQARRPGTPPFYYRSGMIC